MDYKLVWQFQSTSGLPADQIVWTTSFRTDGDGNTIPVLFAATNFVTEPPAGPGGDTVGQFLSNSLTSFVVKAYRRGLPPNTPPVATSGPIALPVRSNANDLPGELAICVSQKSTVIGIPSPDRERGRFYTGPYTYGANDGTFRPGRVNQTLQTLLADAAEDFGNALEAINGFTRWTMWSTVNGSATDVVSIWVDDEWDVIRKRGDRSSNRQSRSIL